MLPLEIGEGDEGGRDDGGEGNEERPGEESTIFSLKSDVGLVVLLKVERSEGNEFRRANASAFDLEGPFDEGPGEISEQGFASWDKVGLFLKHGVGEDAFPESACQGG